MNEIVRGLAFKDYQAVDAVSRSFLWNMIDRSPAHAKAEEARPRKATPEMRFGSLVDCLIFTPQEFSALYTVGGPINPKTGKCYGTETKAWAEFEASLPPGQSVIGAEDLARAEATRNAVLAHPTARRILETGESQLTLSWLDPETGTHCKGRPDIVTGAVLADLKCCADARRGFFSRQMAAHAYHFQLGFYTHGLACLGHEIKGWAWIVVEPEAPHGVKVHEASHRLIRQAAAEVRTALDLYADCAGMDYWPNYLDAVNPIDLPTYAQDPDIQ